MKITRKELRKLIESTIQEGMFDTADREIGGSSMEGAKADARANGKAYFVQRDDEVLELTYDAKSGKVFADSPGITSKEAFDRNDGVVHYAGNL